MMKAIFTATSGRSGSFSLASIINKYAIGAVCEHEPPSLLLAQLRRFNFVQERDWFGAQSRYINFGHKIQRRFLVTDEMLGRGKVLQWYGDSDTEKLGNVVDRRIRRMRRFRWFGYGTYIESSHYFIRHFAEETMKRIPDLGLIKLTRDPIETARSLANRNREPFRQSLPPNHKVNIFIVPEWRRLSSFQIYLVQWIEQQLRYHQFVDRHEIEKLFVIRTSELSENRKVSELFDYFAINHRPINDLKPTNTNALFNLPETAVTNSDIAEFHQIIDLLPTALLERIDSLRDYSALN